MNKHGRGNFRRIFNVLAAFLILATLQPANAQLFDDTLIQRVRAASRMVPGHLPLELRFQVFAHYSGPMSSWVEDGSSEVVPGVIGVFQIRFPDGWIMVDAGGEKEMIQWDVEFSDEDYELVGKALRGANMIVVSHEHADHIAGLVRGRWAADAARRALLTSEQLESLIKGPDHPGIQLSRQRAEQFLSVKYDQLLPISPGVVLIKAPGHSAGSQMVFVKLDNGTELLLVGDAVWVTTALERGSQKPLDVSSRLGEDRDVLASQIQWLRQLRHDGLYVVVAHDAPALDVLIDMGIIKDGVRLSRSD